MQSLDAISSWADPDPPTTPSYRAVGRYGVRRGLPIALAVVGVQLAYWVAVGDYAFASFLVGATVASAVAFVAGVAAAFEDAWVAVAATAGSVGVLAATATAMRAFAPGADVQIVVLLLGGFAVLLVGAGGYSTGETARDDGSSFE